MDPKVFSALELALAGVLLIVVLYIGGVFNEGESPIPPGEIVPLQTQAPPPEDTPAPAPTVEATQPPTSTPTLRPVTNETTATFSYEIAPGDTCLGIAFRFNVSLESLITANNLDPECRIIAGNTLVLPQPASPAP